MSNSCETSEILSTDKEYTEWFEIREEQEEKIEYVDLSELSSCFVSATYDFKFECLRLVFKTNPNMFYDYHISPDVWEDFIKSDSKGKFYHQHILKNQKKKTILDVL